MNRMLRPGLVGCVLVLLVATGVATARVAGRSAPVLAPPLQGTPTLSTPFPSSTASPTSGPPTATPSPLPVAPCGWYRTASVNVGTSDSNFEAVAAVAENDIWAVGSQPSVYTAPLIEHWNGHQWQTSVVPNPGPVNVSILYGVAARTATDAWAVGYYYPCYPCSSESLLEHWDGTAWSVVPAPHAGTGHNVLYGVTLRTANDAWAVGVSYTATGTEMLILHWDGSAWTISPSPGLGTADSVLYDVAAVAADDAWAAGYIPCSGCVAQTLLLHWDGTTWTVVPSPSPGTAHNELHGLEMISATDGWAVGVATYVNYTSEPLALHWDGSTWSVVLTPHTGTGGDSLADVAARAANDVWAVGNAVAAGGYGQTLTMHWDGSAWTLVPGVNPSTSQNDFVRVAVTQDAAWAVGFYRDSTSSTYRTLAARHAAVCITTTPTPIPFTDTAPGDPFYSYIQTLVARGIVSGYTTDPPCVTGVPCFRPRDAVTRGQSAKIVAAAAGLADPIPSTQQTFADVPPGHPFWLWIERLAARSIFTGYPCGGPFEPCGPGQSLYFRAYNVAIRGQASKIIANTFFPSDRPPDRFRP
jgi:hypothetical protein